MFVTENKKNAGRIKQMQVSKMILPGLICGFAVYCDPDPSGLIIGVPVLDLPSTL